MPKLPKVKVFYRFNYRRMLKPDLNKKMKRSATTILGTLGILEHFRHFPNLFEL